MGIKGLWKILEPAAEVTDLESLRGKRVAVDANIWMYQFHKAIRDRKGSVIRGAALLGFCRRICKLMYYGVRPVFVFDGSGPRLKKFTLEVRRLRREAATRNEAEAIRKLGSKRIRSYIASVIQNKNPDKNNQNTSVNNLQQWKSPRKLDDDHYNPKGSQDSPNFQVQEFAEDPRLITRREIENSIKDYIRSNDISMELDLNSEYFKSLPISTQYDLITQIKEGSREFSSTRSLKMKSLSSSPLAFSNLQIKYLTRRNEIVQRLTSMNRMPQEDELNHRDPLQLRGVRVAGQRNREYILCKENFIDTNDQPCSGKEDDSNRSSSQKSSGDNYNEVPGFTILDKDANNENYFKYDNISESIDFTTLPSIKTKYVEFLEHDSSASENSLLSSSESSESLKSSSTDFSLHSQSFSPSNKYIITHVSIEL